MKYRDLMIHPMTDRLSMVVACDVSASIGEKELDVFKVPVPVVAAFTLRVVLFELLSFGVVPHTVISLVGNDFESIGMAAIQGLRGELSKARLEDIAITGSTEDNMEAKTTSIGITAIAMMDSDFLAEKPKLEPGDTIVRIGHPWCGPDVLANESTLPSYDDLRRLLDTPGVVDVLPVGSKGTFYEAEEMVMTHGCVLDVDAQARQDESMTVSAGPATSLVAGVRTERVAALQEQFADVAVVGIVKKK